MARNYHQGLFKPKNPKKYMGNANNIVYRSSWEKKMLNYLDSHPDVISYASEEFFIPYLSPIDNKLHKYYPDMLVKRRNKQGIVETLVVEIKPKHQTQPPTTKKSKRIMLEESVTFAINQAKWKAAENFCADRKWKFVVLTEENLGIK
jgi:hypothetical protein